GRRTLAAACPPVDFAAEIKAGIEGRDRCGDPANNDRHGGCDAEPPFPTAQVKTSACDDGPAIPIELAVLAHTKLCNGLVADLRDAWWPVFRSFLGHLIPSATRP